MAFCNYHFNVPGAKVLIQGIPKVGKAREKAIAYGSFAAGAVVPIVGKLIALGCGVVAGKAESKRMQKEASIGHQSLVHRIADPLRLVNGQTEKLSDVRHIKEVTLEEGLEQIIIDDELLRTTGR